MDGEIENVPPFLRLLYEGDRELYDLVMQSMEKCMPETGSIPKKYSLLLSMVADGVLYHPEGVEAMAEAARQAGATDQEIREALRVIYLTGGMMALANSLGALRKHPPQ